MAKGILPSPDCRDGKHGSCTDTGWNKETETVCPCPCTHHVRN